MKLNLMYEIQKKTLKHITDIALGRDRFHIRIKNNYYEGEIKWK